ncbi:MAG: PAS domain S-box protein [Candidatus Binataceae bacterium]
MSRWTSPVLGFHLVAIAACATFLLGSGRSLFDRYWRELTLGLSGLIFASMAAIGIVRANPQPLLIAILFTMMGCAALMPWGARWQNLLSLLGIAAMAVQWAFYPNTAAITIYSWTGLVAMALLAHFAALIRTNDRIEAAERMRVLRENRDQLIAEMEVRRTLDAERQRTRNQLAQSETRFRAVFNASLDAIAITRLDDGRYMDVNQAFTHDAGYSRDQALDSSVTGLRIWASADERAGFTRRLRASHGIIHNYEAMLRGKGGVVRPFLISTNMIEVDGQPCVVSFTRDITQIKQTQSDLMEAREELKNRVEALRRNQERLHAEVAERKVAELRAQQSEAALRRIFETSPDAIAVTSSSEARLLHFNDEFVRISGFNRNELEGRLVRDLPIWVHREQQREYQGRLDRDGAVRNLEVDLRSKNGTVRPYLVSGAMVDLEGQPCLLTIAREISEYKLARQQLLVAREELNAQVVALRESQRQLRTEIAEREIARHKVQESEATLRKIFDTTLVAIAIVRKADGRFVGANREFLRIFDYRWEELRGRAFQDVTNWVDREQLLAFARSLDNAGAIAEAEAEVRRKGGAVVPLQLSAAVVEIDGEPCVITISQDISRRKRIEREMIRARETALAASRAKSEFLSSMSHEIRTPMNAILGMADLLWDTPLNVEQRHYLDTMRVNGGALLGLINGILDLAKIESGHLNLESIPFQLDELVDRVVGTLGPHAHEKGLELAGRIMNSVPLEVIGDPMRLRQVLINLIGNAIKFTERGEVTLSVDHLPLLPGGGMRSEANRMCLRFTISDSGIGIARDKLATIFASFAQAESSTARRYGGSGLGLAIVKRLVELMSGEISVDSNPGRGSRFTVTIPLTIAHGESNTNRSGVQTVLAWPASRLALDGLSGQRALIADSSPVNRLIIRDVLEPAGLEIVDAERPDEMLEKLASAQAASRPFNLVLLGNRMPTIDSIELARQTLCLRTGGNAPAVLLMLTSEALNPVIARMHELRLDAGGRCRYIVKPIRRTDLVNAITALTGNVAVPAIGATQITRKDSPAISSRLIRGDAGVRGVPDIASLMVARPLQILLAEDSPDNRLLIAAYLKNTPYHLDHAENGQIAIEHFKRKRYDVVLMDIQMPVVDGYTAVETIRAWEREEHQAPTPIVALTASALDEAVQRSLTAGCTAHIAKPVRKATLLEAIKSSVSGSATFNVPK